MYIYTYIYTYTLFALSFPSPAPSLPPSLSLCPSLFLSLSCCTIMRAHTHRCIPKAAPLLDGYCSTVQGLPCIPKAAPLLFCIVELYRVCSVFRRLLLAGPVRGSRLIDFALITS